MSPVSDRLVIPAWLATRGLIVALIFLVSSGDPLKMQDVGYYLEVGRHLLDTGTMPNTEMWQYPPGATAVMVGPLLAGDAGFGVAFVFTMLACDAVITWLLWRSARTNGSRLGLWAWLIAMPAMREYPLLRFDLVPTLFAVAALTFLVRRPALFGLFAGLGALVKAWPIVVLAAEWNLRRLLVATVVASVVVVVGVTGAGAIFGDQQGALDNQVERGLQTESVAASPWHLAAILQGGDAVAPTIYGSGATEINSPRADRVADQLRIATLVVSLLLATWWSLRGLLARRDPARNPWLASMSAGVDLVFVGVLLAVVTSRVLSPQFMVWLLGIAAVALSFPDTRLRRPLAVVIAATFLSAGVLKFPEVLVARNALLAVASVDALVLLFLGLRPGASVLVGDNVDRQLADLLDAQPAAARDPQHVVDRGAVT